ncbi:type II secretion system protein [Moritella marina ATCC 15381]|uniref:Type II secretion system protein n=1 Tax=Moritella marina ATCC 15381 TaxID=1202962 RepID=A0A5J6WF80_MORMI|nr:type II secretion system protein [Moritella marina]QFI36476.1 type II secretion system protein [Moritella marina ATCC 15381]
MPKQQYMKSHHAKSKGFTLIELVIVIIVLGVLAATAVPKFINLRADSKAATLEAIRGSMESAMQLVYAKAAIEGKTTGEAEITINGVQVPIYNGYPAFATAGTLKKINEQLKALLEIDSVGADVAEQDHKAAPFYISRSSRNGVLYIMFSSDVEFKGVNFKCQVNYTNKIPNPNRPNDPIVPLSIGVLTEQC